MKLFREILSGLVIMEIVVLAIPGRSDAVVDAAFLDRPLPPEIMSMVHPVSTPDPNKPGAQVQSPMIKVSSLAGAIDLLEKASGKKVILDEALGTWPGEDQEKVWGIGMGLAKDEKARAVFESVCGFAGLNWNYDTASGTIFVVPEWKRTDSRSEKELIQIVGQTLPVRWDALLTSATPNRLGGHSLALDAWRIAFDALLSKPDNYPTAGTLRVYHDSHGHMSFCPFPVQNDFTGPIQGDHGEQEILVLNEQVSMSNKDSAGDLAYYLFNEDGKFLKGGVYAVADGAESGIVKVALESNRTITIDVGYGSFKMNPDHLHHGFGQRRFYPARLNGSSRQGKRRGGNAEVALPVQPHDADEVQHRRQVGSPSSSPSAIWYKLKTKLILRQAQDDKP